MNNLFWICVGIALGALFPKLTDTVSLIMTRIFELLIGV